ncbi:MAG TPA: hypothetical protein VE685_10055 [Thermoanaerobaculia bacterium]|nr:hypothetical protein [Thermoanaerobaculia bacterium]
MNYWLDLYTGKTWEDFRKNGARVTGFRTYRANMIKRVARGDILLCYLTGVMRWVGTLRVVGPAQSTNPAWPGPDFPVQLEVEPLVLLDPEEGIPMQELEGKMDFYRGPDDRSGYRGFVRGSPNLFKRPADGALLVSMLEQARANPIRRPVDEKKLGRVYRYERKEGKETVSTVVTVPDNDVPPPTVPAETAAEEEATLHTEIQYLLLTLGAQMGLDIWVARNDRGRTYKGLALGGLPRMVEKLPTQFNEVTNRTIELIDVLWLQGNSIMAAFEVESTTAVYSGLLRMSDLLALQPNIDIRLFIVAPDDRRNKVGQEILRPTFTLREKPLNRICGFLPFNALSERVRAIQTMGLAPSLRPDFLQRMAEYFGEEGEE